MDIKVEGADKLGRLAKDLRRLGDKDLQKELYAGLNRATKTLRADGVQAERDRLPKEGGLAKKALRGRMSTRRRGGRWPGVRIVARGIKQLDRIDRLGKVRHPVYGHRGRWVDQSIPGAKGWFTDTMEAGAPTVREELVKVIDDVARKVTRKL